MHYFVSVENSSYFYWQLELLIESMIQFDLQDKLIIAFSENTDPKIKEYSKNLVKYGVKIFFPNIGKQLNYPPINRVNTIHRLFDQGILKTPFTLLHSDMIMKKPIDDYNKPFDFVINNYDVSEALINEYFQDEKIREKIKSENEVVTNDSIFFELKSHAPIIFNETLSDEFLNKFFNKLIINTRNLLEEKGNEFPCEKVAWKLTFLESIGHYTAIGETLTCDLIDSNIDVPFIHYNIGIPPVFHKSFFKFENPSLYYDGPFENILQQNISENIEFVKNLIRSYRKKH